MIETIEFSNWQPSVTKVERETLNLLVLKACPMRLENDENEIRGTALESLMIRDMLSA